MDILTIGLMLAAGLLHASWHSLVKSGQNQITVLAGMGAVAGLCACAALPLVPTPPPAAWPVLLLSVTLHIGYKLCLAGAYMRGDFGQAFPLARGMVPLFATLIAFVSLGQMPSITQCVGIALVSSGLLLLAFDKLNGLAPWPLLTTATAAGAAVAAYSTVDAYGTRLFGDWLGFTAWLIALDSLTFFLVSWVLRGGNLWVELHATRWRILVSGLLGLLSFCVFLWALSRNAVGAVTTVRETSVLFAMAIGVVLHHEALSWRRIGGAVLIFAAIIVIAI
ncbi:EamA family transporter [Tardiphaga sp. 367_B4_N1_1]|uniref:EamA family transporter n=1 Tax=Tardiphaga sp. 367_B4_N1_1 TaxID=3240777 RepID=UPI003F26D061